MKKKLCFLFLISAVLTSSCKKEDLGSLKRVQLNTVFKSSAREKVYVSSDKASLTLEVQAITDNRCPSHDFCSDPGECSVRITLSDSNKSTGETILIIDNSNDHQSNDVQLRLNNKNYFVHLRGVSPKPFLQNGIPKEAEFMIESGANKFTQSLSF